jgi:pimeloyl-ACP methyl ester carboxylesterase
MLSIPIVQKLFLCPLMLLTLSCAAFAPLLGRSVEPGQVGLRPCRFPNHAGELLCGKYEVYENRAAKAGRTLTLNVLIMPALTPAPVSDPVFFLAGGPGQGAARIARAGEDRLMRELRRERDLVFIDQRGTGDSNRLGCSISGDRDRLQNYFPEVFEVEAIGACRRTFERNADLQFYTTPIAMDDMEDIRRAIGYDKINLHAVSYGTVGALEYIRRYPDRVRSALLAGVATPAAKLPLQFAQGAQQAMEKLITDCGVDETCRSAFPRLKDDFTVVLAAFSNGPVRFELTPPQSRSKQLVTLSLGVFTERLRLMLNDHSSARLLPLLIHRAAHGDWQPFGNVAVRSAAVSAYTLALGTYLTITCSESVSFITPAELADRTAGTFLGDYRVQRHRSACAGWPRGEIPSKYFLPVESDVPVLMLSGDIDPATPKEFGRAAAGRLTNSRQVLLRNTPHSYTSACARALTVEFIAEGSAENLDATCAERIRRPRFLTELPERYQR